MINEEEKDVRVRQFWRKWRKMESNRQVLGAAKNIVPHVSPIISTT